MRFTRRSEDDVARQTTLFDSIAVDVGRRHQREAALAVFDFIDGWYNPHRRHSALGYLSPVEFERRKSAAA